MTFKGPKVRAVLREEVRRFKDCGGSTIVDNSSTGTKLPNHAILDKKLSQDTGVHIIVGTGWNGGRVKS